MGLSDRPALVVGGGSGIGRATARLLAAAGARVAVADIDEERAATVAAEVGGVAVVGDVTDAAAAAAVVDEAHDALGGLSAVTNIVGAASWSDLLSMDLDTFEDDLRINLMHHLHVGRAAAPHLLAAGGGSMAFVSSVSSLYGAPMHGAYGVAKAGLNSLVRTMAAEWGRGGIRVNAVAPDIIATPRVVAGVEARGGTRADLDARAMATNVPLGRFGEPEEIAGPLVFLLSDLASFVTGQTLVADGGTFVQFRSDNSNNIRPESGRL